MPAIDPSNEIIVNEIHHLVEQCGGNPSTFEGDLLTQQIQNTLKLLNEGHHIGQLKLMTRALKEMRYAYRIFNDHTTSHRISIFGSARTPESHPDYLAAVKFSQELAKRGWMCITGAADGIMKAGMEGTQVGGSFGLSIRLPFESPTNQYLKGDPKLIHFRYFFTRKLMFMSHASAIAVFPGGFGTMDELFEILTLMQTGKNKIIPVVLLEGSDGDYWHHWEKYVKTNLIDRGFASAEDRNLYYIAHSIDDGVAHLEHFFKRYHSSRYVNDILVIRLVNPLTPEQIDTLNTEFSSLIKSGAMTLSKPLPEEDEFLDLSRLVFHHTRRDFSMLRQLIDRINSF
jgi:hypothetical protein